ncbi:MAG: hypothetical protein AB7N76_33110 [Planctomycetota bacterium]
MPPSTSYRQLLRRLARDEELRPEHVAPLLAALGRTPEQLASDLAALRRRKELDAAAAELLELRERRALADEGFRLVEEAALRARAEATARLRRARRTLGAIDRRVAEAAAAERALKALLDPGAVAAWEDAEGAVQAARAALRAARCAGRNVERHEAWLEQAEAAYRAARRAALDS